VHGVVDLARGNELAYDRRAHRGIGPKILGGFHNVDAQLTTVPHIVGKGLLLVVPEVVVVAGHESSHPVAVAQQLDEAAAVEQRELAGEVEQHRAVDAVARDELELVVDGHYHLDSSLGVQHGLRVLGKGDYCRLEPALPRLLLEKVEQGGVAQVHAVKHANGGYCRAWLQLCVAAYYLHDSACVTGWQR
jgi:hypothetical protein